MTPGEPAPLNYSALPGPWLRRKRVRRLLLAILLAAVVVVGWRWGPPMWRAARFRYAEQKCLSYTAPANQIVYEDGLPASSLLWDDSQPVGGTPTVDSTFPHVRTRVIRCWHALQTTWGGPTFYDGILFLHARQDASGQQWLVGVRIDSRSANALNLSGFTVRRWDDLNNYESFQGSWFVGMTFVGGEQLMEKLRIYAGQVDPSDGSRFTIPLEIGTRKGRIKGQVLKDGGVDLDLTLDPVE